MDYTINRKTKMVTFKIGDTQEEKTFEETYALIYLLMRKLASSHRA